MSFPEPLLDLAMLVLEEARKKGLMIATAESCTGGLIAGCLTEIPGSSDVLACGFVTYSNAAKTKLIGVPADMIAAHGAVSEQVARAMATGALASSGATLSVACTGVAGPGGGTAQKPVGLVHIAAAREGKPVLHEEQRFGDLGRGPVREKTIEAALKLLLRAM